MISADFAVFVADDVDTYYRSNYCCWSLFLCTTVAGRFGFGPRRYNCKEHNWGRTWIPPRDSDDDETIVVVVDYERCRCHCWYSSPFLYFE